MSDSDKPEEDTKLAKRPPHIRSKEKPLKLTDPQHVDIQIGVLLGLGMTKNEDIGRKVGYSQKGIFNRRNGINALLISEVENMVKHELKVSRRKIEDVAAENLTKALGERSGKVLDAIDDVLDDRYVDKVQKAKVAMNVAARAILPSRSGGRPPGKPLESGTVYNVNIGEMKVVHAHVQGQPITVPDRAKLVDVTPATVALPVAEGQTVPR